MDEDKFSEVGKHMLHEYQHELKLTVHHVNINKFSIMYDSFLATITEPECQNSKKNKVKFNKPAEPIKNEIHGKPEWKYFFVLYL